MDVFHRAEELNQLNDKLNLTGQVFRVGEFAVKHGGCAYIWLGVLLVKVSVNNGIQNTEIGEEQVAVKVIREFTSSASVASLRRRLIREIRAWSILHHRNVLNLLGFTYGFEAHSRLPSLVSPWMPNGTSRDYLKGRNKSERIRILTGVADGLCYLHRHDVVHGDLKGDNILIDERMEPRLADFGLSKILTEADGTRTATDTAGVLGSLRWMAKELFDSDHGVTCQSDIWAFAMTAIELFTGEAPYHHFKFDAQVIKAIVDCELPRRPESDAGIDDDLWNLCCKCWDANPEMRPSMRVLTKELWDQDLKCKLRSSRRRRRRESDSPERTDGSTDGQDGFQITEGRLRKSPRHSLLTELGGGCLSPPDLPIVLSRALVRTPTPRTPSSSASSRFASRRQSGSHLYESQHLFPSQSDGHLHSTMHDHLQHGRLPRMRPSRGYTEPTTPIQQYYDTDIMGYDPGNIGVPATPDFDPRLDTSLALMSTRNGDLFSPVLNTPQRGLIASEEMYNDGQHPYPFITTDPDIGGYLDLNLVHSAICPQDTFYVCHPSQWTSFPPATSPSPSRYPRSHHERSLSFGHYQYAGFMTPPSRQIASQGMQATPPLGFSPQQSPIPLDAVGPIFSENFSENYAFGEPLINTPPLSNLTPIMNQDPSRFPAHGAPMVDFTSMQQGVLSPALSDLGASPQLGHRSIHPPPPVESPLFQDLDSFDDPSDSFSNSLALFGGVEEGAYVPVVPDHPTIYASSHTVRPDSPQLLASAPPLTRSPQSNGSANLHPLFPPTPRMSPLLSDFPCP